MDYPEHYESDVLSFFDGRPDALALYRVLAAGLARIAPEGRVKVQKSQISFYDGGLFAMASLPKRKGDPGLVVSFGLGRRDPSPRIGAAVEPYPGRWTHHLLLSSPEEADDELMAWVREAAAFSAAKRYSRHT